MAPIVRGNSLYAIVDGPSWTQAEANAVKLGGHLITISNNSEWEWFKSEFRPANGYAYAESFNYYPNGEVQLWIGLNDARIEGLHEWVSGQTSEINANDILRTPNDDYGVWQWERGKVTTYPNDLNISSPGWASFARNIRGVAEVPFVQRGDSAYVIVEGPTWEAAEANAVKLGGHLVTINDTSENSFIASTFGKSAYTAEEVNSGQAQLWIGFSDRASEGNWNWEGGEATTFTGWAPGEPDGQVNYKGNEDYATYILYTSYNRVPGQWADIPSVNVGKGLAEIKLTSSAPTPTYSLSPSSTSLNEGSALTTTVSTTNVASGTALYYSLSGTGISTTDFSSGSLTGSGTVSSNGTFSFSHTLANDLTTEGTETLEIRLYSDSSRSVQVASTSVSISDTSRTPTYSVSASSTTVNEGSTLTTTVNTTNVASGTTLYYSLSGTGINSSDFSSGSLTGLGTVSSSGSFSFSHTLANDLTTEGAETLQIRLFTDSDRSNQVASTSVSISDTSITPPTLPSYLLTPSATTINEGSLVSTTITTTNVASGTTLYWSAVGSGITTSDFSFGALSGSASIGSDGKATFSHVLANDLSTEGTETLNILLYSDSNRSNQIAATSININDTSITPATPTVAVGGNNTGVINTGTINNSGTINSGTINTNSGNTTNTTTNTSNVTVGPTIINNITNNITNTTTNTTSVLSNTSYPTYNVNNTWANNLVTGAITGSAPTLAKNSFDYKFYNLGGGRYGVQEKGSSKIDEITGASSLKFADQTLTPANDVAATFNQVKGKDDVSGVVFRLYNAAFSRLPDANGLQNWINGNASGGMTYASSAQSFSESQEFKNRYGSNVTDTQFITTLYNNVLGRAPDAGGLSHYQSLLAGGRSRGALLLDFSESPENRVLFTQVTGLA